MNIALSLNQIINLSKKDYKVIGIDSYDLKNILGKHKQWTSYTLQDVNEAKTWISFGTAGNYFVQWIDISEDEFKKFSNFSLNLDLTGIANIKFQGNAGYSSPFAEIINLNVTNQNFDFLGIERFLKKEREILVPLESYFQRGLILRDFKP